MICPRLFQPPRISRHPGPGFLVGFSLLAFLCFARAPAFAQQGAPQTAATPLPAQDPGSISGNVIDVDGTLAAGAQVTLTGEAFAGERQATVDSRGQFHFTAVPPGKFSLIVSSDGLAPASASGTLQPGQHFEIPQMTLRVATASTDVEVNLSQKDLAEAEIRTEEKQRLFGFAPNFYVTYTFDAKPLTPKQKWELAYKSSIDPLTFVIVGGFAGIQQADNIFPEYGQGAAGYGKRYATTYANTVVGNMLGGALFPIIFRQDPRYFYKGTGTRKSRALYALSTAVIARGDNGKWQPAYAGILGSLAAGGLSNAYYPAPERAGGALTIENALLGMAFTGAGNFCQEFLFRKASSHARPWKPTP